MQEGVILSAAKDLHLMGTQILRRSAPQNGREFQTETPAACCVS
jgi:hypothetical protein